MSETFLSPIISDRILVSVALVGIFYLIKATIVYLINRRIEDINVRHSYRKLTVYLCSFIPLVILLIVWIKHIDFGIFFSIIGAGVVISLADFILSFVGWLYIVTRKPFEVGERVQIGSVKGDVIDIRGFFVTLLEIGEWVEAEQSTGRIVNIPNNFIFRNPVYNYSKGFNFIWNEIKILITFESNYGKASDICLKYLNEFHNTWAHDLDKKMRHAQNYYAVYYRRFTPIVYKEVSESGIRLSLRYLVEPRRRRFSENFLYEKILVEFTQAPDIHFAYTTYRLTK